MFSPVTPPTGCIDGPNPSNALTRHCELCTLTCTVRLQTSDPWTLATDPWTLTLYTCGTVVLYCESSRERNDSSLPGRVLSPVSRYPTPLSGLVIDWLSIHRATRVGMQPLVNTLTMKLEGRGTIETGCNTNKHDYILNCLPKKTGFCTYTITDSSVLVMSWSIHS